MSEVLVGNSILAEAEKREKEYDWLGAAESYEKSLQLVSEQDFSKSGGVCERLGFAFYRAAMQANTGDEFRQRISQAVRAYEKSSELYAKLDGPGERARSLRSQAMIFHLGFWLASEPTEKKKQLDESWRLAKEALKGFQKSEEALEFGKTYNLLVASAIIGLSLDSSFESVEKTVREAVEHGERAINALSTLGDSHELASAYVKTGAQLGGSGFLQPDLDERDRIDSKLIEYSRKANEISEESALLASSLPEGQGGVYSKNRNEAITISKKALEYCTKTKDKLSLGRRLEELAENTFWKSVGTEDPEERLRLVERALQYAQDAKRQFSPISFISVGGNLWTEAPEAEYYWTLATWETDLVKRRQILEKANEAAPDRLERAEKSGYPHTVSGAHHAVSKTLASLAKTENNPEEKRRLLEKALDHRNKSIRSIGPLERFAFWNQGVYQNYLAEIISELADLAKDPETKNRMLGEAVEATEAALRLCLKDLQQWEKTTEYPENRAALGRWQHEHGNLLTRLYQLTADTEHLRKAAEAFENAAESFQKANLASRMAECYWRSALTQDALDEHLRAAEKFSLASDNYRKAAEKIPQLKDFYMDYASYMEGWSEIERARHHHSRQDYGLAKENYEKAASLHRNTKRWAYLATNYSAWAQVENAEDLSRRELNEEAIQAFEDAAKLFPEGKNSLQTALNTTKNLDERRMTTGLVKAADMRGEYCKARIILEQAIILDKKGDHYSSSEKYGLAAESFDEITHALESERDRVEIRLIMTLARAWQMMTRAEAEQTASLYAEASSLFEEAKKLSPNEKAGFLAMGHSRFCRALEAGTTYAETKSPALHAVAIDHLESASRYYVRAGFQNASEYAKASRLLFDAYSYMDEANREKDLEKKAKFYALAERVLRASAESYVKAEHPEKRDQAQQLLERVREEQQLALSLTQVLNAPSIISTTQAFTTPTASYEAPVGLERFEHADIQASLIARQRNLKVGEDLDLEIELVNSGRGAAQLIKLEEVVPEGFELTERPETYRIEDHYLNMKGKQLAPLKTEELKLVLKPRVKGSFTLKPRILYLDEGGKYKSHEPEGINITVSEMGITGWLKGR